MENKRPVKTSAQIPILRSTFKIHFTYLKLDLRTFGWNDSFMGQTPKPTLTRAAGERRFYSACDKLAKFAHLFHFVILQQLGTGVHPCRSDGWTHAHSCRGSQPASGLGRRQGKDRHDLTHTLGFRITGIITFLHCHLDTLKLITRGW